MSKKPICERCGNDYNMIWSELRGEWSCHSTHVIDDLSGKYEEVKKKTDLATIDVEDLVTVVCETFVEIMGELGYDPVCIDKQGVEDWYMRRNNDADRKAMSKRVVERIEQDMKSIGEKK